MDKSEFQPRSPMHPGLDVKSASPGRVIAAVLAVMDSEAISYCLTHGYECLPEHTGSDIDIIIDRSVSPARLKELFAREESMISARVVASRDGYLSFLGETSSGMPTFITFDFTSDEMVGPYVLASGADIIRNRRRCRDFWIPDPAMEFRLLLMRSIMKRRMTTHTTLKLTQLFVKEPLGIWEQMRKDWPDSWCETIRSAASSGDWKSVSSGTDALRRILKKRLVRAAPLGLLLEGLRTQGARLSRLLHPPGINVVLLGPDGAGKSSTIAALETALAPLFNGTEVRGFAPSLRQLLQRKPSSTATPHALKPRPLGQSLLRAAYWMLHGTLGYVSIHAAKSRSRLILNDRHFMDILVDTVRYRYGGPVWLLHLIWWLMPKPDVIILLNGPADVLQARKRELTVEETARQSKDYLALVKQLRNSHVIDATQPSTVVVRQVAQLILSYRA